MTTAAQVFYKIGANKLALDFSKLITNWFIPVGFILYVTAGIILIFSLKHGEVSVLYPIFATSYIWVMIVSAIIFGDKFNSLKILGSILIIVGIIWLSIGGTRKSAIAVEEPL